jgi:hypothetical protein
MNKSSLTIQHVILVVRESHQRWHTLCYFKCNKKEYAAAAVHEMMKKGHLRRK